MMPSFSQVRQAAFYRWEQRSGEHGRDRDDWLASEQDLLFSFNYEVIAHYPLDGVQERFIGDVNRRKCRFCELAAPQASFGKQPRAIPESFGNRTLFANDQCDECSATFAESIEGDLTAFARRFLGSAATDDGGGAPSLDGNGIWNGHGQALSGLLTEPYRPLAAFKGLTKLALSIMPERELPHFEDAVEWVSNPDHGYDAPIFEGLRCYVHQVAGSEARPAWAVLARRTDDNTQVPYSLFFLGTRGVTFQIAVPLCHLDDENDGKPFIVPRISNPLAVSRDVAPVPVKVVSLSSPEVRRSVVFEAEAAVSPSY